MYALRGRAKIDGIARRVGKWMDCILKDGDGVGTADHWNSFDRDKTQTTFQIHISKYYDRMSLCIDIALYRYRRCFISISTLLYLGYLFSLSLKPKLSNSYFLSSII